MEIFEESIKSLSQKIHNGELSSTEVTQYFLDRIEKYKDLNAFITVTGEQAKIQSGQADKDKKAGILAGLPYAAKDLFNTKGIRTTAASKILDNYISPYNSTVIEKLNDQDAVLLGKTNMDQFAHGSSGETSFYGPALNPWDISRMPGGSSSGSAVAVAAGLAPYALATETGGSIRQPASLCGISGWKPTYGRVSRYGVIAMASSLDSMGVMAKSIEDIAYVANAIAGKDDKDSTTGSQDIPDFVNAIENFDIKGKRIGIPKEYFVKDAQGEVNARVMEAIKEFEKMGATLVEVDLPNTKYGSLVYAIVCPSEVSSNLARYDGIRYGHVTEQPGDLMDIYMKSRAEGFGDEAKRRIMIGTYVLSAGYYDAYYKKAQKVRGLIMEEFKQVFEKVDCLMAPSSPNTALSLGKAADDPLFGYIADQLNIPSSLAGLPAVSIPCGFAPSVDDSETPDPRGLPVGLQIIGKQWDDGEVMAFAHQYQKNTDWHKQLSKIAYR